MNAGRSVGRSGGTGRSVRALVGLVFKNLRINLKHKLSLAAWWRQRGQVSNWLPLYLLTSSLLVQTAARVLWGSGWLRRRALRVRRTDGATLYFPLWRYMRDPMTVLVYMYESYMDRLRSLDASRVFAEDGVVVDIGAHVGTFAIPLLVHHHARRVVAVEPDPWNANCLRRGATESGIDRHRFAVVEAAVSDVATSAVEFVLGDTATRGTLAGTGFFREGKAHGRISVGTIMLEQLFEEHEIDRCALLKVDCEGCEYAIFDRLPQSVWARIERIILEVHPREGQSTHDLVDAIRTQGFTVDVDPQANGCLELFCVRDPASQDLGHAF